MPNSLRQAPLHKQTAHFLGGGAFHKLLHLPAVRAMESGMGGDSFRSAIRNTGVGVHHTCGQFHEFAGVTNQQKFLYAFIDGVIQCFPDVVGAFNADV